MTTFQMAALIKVTFDGADSSGGVQNISVPGVKAGDVVLSIHRADNPNGGEFGPANSTSPFALQPVLADDHIRQNGGFDLTAVTFTAVLLRFA